MNSRDRDYIENRLYSCNEAMEAYGRMQQVGEYQLAEELMSAMKDFNDRCREIRKNLIKKELGLDAKS